MRSHPLNAPVFTWLGLDPAAPLRLIAWADSQTGFEPEGATALLDELAGGLPDGAKAAFSVHHGLVHPDTGVIFGLLHGRYTFLVRCPTPNAHLTTSTLDGEVDARALGEPWTFFDPEDDDAALLRQAYALAGRA